MKSLPLAAAILLTTSIAAAQNTEPYLVPREARSLLVEMKAAVHHGDGVGPYEAELTVEQVARLRAHGHVLVRDDHRHGPPDAAMWTPYATMRANFVNLAATYPAICEFHVLGPSVQGRDLFGLRISDNVSVEENEPEIAFWGSHHGDEFASGEIPHDWAAELLAAYGTDPTATAFVDDHEIWLVPLLNPDGHELGRRGNANNVDLNRDNGWQWDGWGGSPSPWSQPESQALHQFLLANNLTLSATMHCSGNVLFFPWCSTPTHVSEFPLVTSIGQVYSSAANYGLKNSWADYETHGELIPVLYGAFGSLCYTVEISNNFNIYGDSYSRNRDAMRAYCGVAGTGLHGTVIDATSGQPLRAAVWVSGSPHPAYTDPTVGDVHRVVLDGTYSGTAWASGYRPRTVSGISVSGGVSAPFQIALDRGGNGHALMVTSVNQRDPGNSYANLTSPSDALGVPDGVACSLGRNGFIVLDMGAGNDIVDGPGVDFTITEAMVAGDTLPESYEVFAGGAYSQPVALGGATGTASFDLAAAGLVSTRYLRIVDASQAASNDPLAGVELDAVTILNRAGAIAFDGDTGTISLGAGGAQTLSLNGPEAGAPFVVLGSVSGSTPGVPLTNSFLTMPLNVDGYFLSTVGNPTALMANAVGVLDANGQATATFALPAGLSPALQGLVFEHAFLLVDVANVAPSFVSNPVSLTLTL